MPRVRMRDTRMGSPNGTEVRRYEVGEEYNLPASLASVFMSEGWAEEVKSAGAAPENKMMGAASEHKALTCEVCGYEAKTKAGLGAHMRSHN